MATWPASSRIRATVAGAVAGGTLLLALGVGAAAAETHTFQLLNGDVVRGEVLERDEKRVVIRHAVLGRLEIPVDQLASATTHPGLLGSKVLAGWTKELNLGFGGSYGDTDEADLRIATTLDFKDATTHWRIQGRYVLGFSDGEIDDHNAQATLLRDWLWAESK